MEKINSVNTRGNFYVCENGLGSTYVNRTDFLKEEARDIACSLGRVFHNQEGYRLVQFPEKDFFVYQDKKARIHMPLNKKGSNKIFTSSICDLMTLEEENERCRKEPNFAHKIAVERHYSE